MMTLALILLISSVAAFSENLLDPMEGTIRGKLGPRPNMVDPDAHGNIILNYVKGQDRFEVQVNVVKLNPNTQYQIHLVQKGNARQNLGTFWTDENGNGHFHGTSPSIQPIRWVNIRLFEGSWGLSSRGDRGGSLRQSPGRR